MQRIDQMKEPPVVGKFYMVPAILWKWNETLSAIWWPVIGELHDDKEFFNFDRKHYHADVRFLNRRHLRIADGWRSILGRPLHSEDAAYVMPLTTFIRMRCNRNRFNFDESVTEGIDRWTNKRHKFPNTMQALRCAYAGVQCKRDEQGWVCPHRRAPLGSVSPVNGVVTCFLHGLRIDAKTGVCLPVEVPAHA